MKNSYILPAILLVLLLIAGCTTNTPATENQTTLNTTPNTTQTGNVTPPVAPPIVIAVSNIPSYGDILVDSNGMTLYVFTKDQIGKTNCYGQCAGLWPPVLADDIPTVDGASGIFGLIVRDDSAIRQVTYNGMPLYTWAKDKFPGDTTGQGVGGVWFVAKTSLTEFPAPAAQNQTQNSTQNGTQNSTLPKESGPSLSLSSNPSFGPLLVDSNGMTLYVFNQDTNSHSNCLNSCASIWPPLLLDSVPSAYGALGVFSLFSRADGSMQAAYNGMPLYRYSGDSVPGDINGEGVGTQWYVATNVLTPFPPAPPIEPGD